MTVPPRRTAQHLALEHVRGLISAGTLRPDDRLRQEQLAADLGTSVIPVREALKTLEAEGLVRYEPHRGYRVARLSIDELTETYLIRRLLEDDVVRTAAPRLDAQVLATLEDAMTTMEQAADVGDVATMISANRAFHFTVFAAAGRPRTVELIRVLWQTTDSYRSMYYTDAAARRRVNHEHRSIVEALVDGDVERAIDELGQHRTHAVDDLVARLED